MTPEELNDLAPGQRVADAQGDLWQKQPDQWWTHRDGCLPSTPLVQVWGPIKLVKDTV